MGVLDVFFGFSKLSLFLCTPATPRSAHPAGTNGPSPIKPKVFEFLGPPMLHQNSGAGFKFSLAQALTLNNSALKALNLNPSASTATEGRL